jgi:tetratricopeptide (TPR) repeat protein
MDTPVQKKTMAGKVGRASRTLGQLWQVPTFALGLVALLFVAATAPLRQDSAVREFEIDLDQVRQALANKHDKINDCVPIAESLLERLRPNSRRAGQVHFLAGSVFQRWAEEVTGPEAEEMRKKAIANLEQARSLGVSDEDTPPLLYRLGVLLFENGAELEKALDLIATSVSKGTDEPARGYGMLVQGYLRLPKPDLEAALAANQKQLQYAETETEIQEARLVGGDLLLRLGKPREALEVLGPIGSKAAPAVRVRARLLQTQCCQQDGQYQEAVHYWRDLLPNATDVPGGKARILYNLARCYFKAEPPNLEEAQALWRQTVDQGGEEGQAAGICLGEFNLIGPAPDPGRGVADLTAALIKVHSPRDYQNKLVSLAKVREVFEATWSHYQERRDYGHAEQLAELYKKVAVRGVAEERQAQSLEIRAKEFETKAQKENGPQADSTREQAKLFYGKAGAAFELAANARPIGQQAGILERSAACFGQAREFAKAVAILQRFVQIHNSEEVLAAGYMGLADAYEALGQKEQAQAALYKCIEYPNTPHAFRARYQLALQAIAEGKQDHAENILWQSLREPNGPIDRDAHCKSLYKYAGLLFQRQNYDKAKLFLELAARQYPEDPKSWSARDRLGFCYRKLADEVSDKLRGKGAEEKNAAYLNNTRRGFRDQAAKIYQDLADDLERLPALSDEQQVLLTRALFAVADQYKEMPELGEAIRRYKNLLEKHRGTRNGILACHRIWLCAGEMYKSSNSSTRRQALEDTRDALQKTLTDVEKMGPDHHAFQGPDRLNRVEVLNWLREENQKIGNELNAPATPPPVPPVGPPP